MRIQIIPMKAYIAKGFPPSDAVEYYVYQGDKLLSVCPSIGMAREVAAGAA